MLSRTLPIFCLAAALAAPVSAAPVISEIMFHPPGVIEDTGLEWIELHNPDAFAVDLGGYVFSEGVTFTLPAPSVVPAGGYLVVAADVAKFQAAHPGYAGPLTGGWTGKLANGGESIRLDSALGVQVDTVDYADEGEWGLRGRGPVVAAWGSHQGWEWFNDADGNGRTLELIKGTFARNHGQAWKVSLVPGGTPGAANSVAAADLAPLIEEVAHRPKIPRTGDVIRVSAVVTDDAGLPVTATLRWRLDGAGAFASLPMADTDGDGDVEAEIPPQANLAIVEYYVEATDGTLSRTWPAPARTSNPGVLPEVFSQTCNALLQVDNSHNPAVAWTPGAQPVIREVLTAAERAELRAIGEVDDTSDKAIDAAMNVSVVIADGTGVEVRHRCSVRNRGFGSREGPPNNQHLSFPNDAAWADRGTLQLNCRYGYVQVLAAGVFARAGIAEQRAAGVQLRVNGLNPGVSGSGVGTFTQSITHGAFARVEPMNGDWLAKHYPLDPDGNLYRADDHAPNTAGVIPGDLGSGEFRYEGTNALAYADTFYKKSNESTNDGPEPYTYNDLINACRVLSAPATGGTAAQPAIPDAAYRAAVESVIDLDQWLTFIAVDALIGNMEGGLQNGRTDDFALYRGLADTRFRLIPHDFDTCFTLGSGASLGATRSIFSYDGEAPTNFAGNRLQGLIRLFNHPDILPDYYAALLRVMDTTFNRAVLDPLIDEIMVPWGVPAGTIGTAKNFVDTRRANVLSQIPQVNALTVTGNAADVDGMRTSTDGSFTFAGNFNVARVRSITINGAPVPLTGAHYRRNGAVPAGTWSHTLSPVGGAIKPGVNRVTVTYHGGAGGTGEVVQTWTQDLYHNNGGGTVVAANGQVGAQNTLHLAVPASYIPGIPFLVEVEVRDGNGNPDFGTWDATALLTADNGVNLTPAGGGGPATVSIRNGRGSLLVNAAGAGGSGGGITRTLFSYGSGGTGATTVTGTGGSVWRTKTDFTAASLAAFTNTVANTWRNEGFDDSAWITRTSQTGYGDGDENQAFTRVDYDTVAAGTQSGPVALFRSTFTIDDVSQVVSVTGEVKYDDAAAVYVNGTEVLSTAGMAGRPLLTQYSSVISGENETAALTIPVGLLHNGVNTIAVEVRQQSDTSSDITFDLRLQADLLSTELFRYGTGGTGTTTVSGTGGSVWRTRTDFTAASLASFITASGSTWMNEGFDDSSWVTRTSQTGYGDGDENQTFTRVDYDTVAAGTQSGPVALFRGTFVIADTGQLASVDGQVKYDDAAVVYVNGTEVLRTAGMVGRTGLATYADAAGTSENTTAALAIPLGLLHNGTNTIAVAVHQHDNASSDISFDLRLQANLASSDPGNFTLTATAGSIGGTSPLTSLGVAPAGVTKSGTLAGSESWSGVVRVTGDVTVPVGATLTIEPGTHVLVSGTPFGDSVNLGADLIVRGALVADGSAAAPISITCANPSNRWGEITFAAGALPSSLRHCLVSRGAHSPHGGHTGTGPLVRLAGTTLVIEDSVLSDSPGKAMTNTGNCDITVRRSHFARLVMGPELTGSAILIEDSHLTDMLPGNRDFGAADDEDCIYLHNSGGRPVLLRRTVLAHAGDDVLDCLAGSLTVEDSIMRNGLDKGVSLLQNNIVLRRCLIIDNDIGVSAKCQTGADESVPYSTLLENCTIVCENHPANDSDGSIHSVGVHTNNKYGTAGMNITQTLVNCIVSAEEPFRNDYPALNSTVYPLMVMNYSDTQDLGGANPANAVPAGTGNLALNPLYANASLRDFRLQAGSPCRDSGDPARLDADGSRSDMGALPYGTGGGGSLTNIVWGLSGSPYRVTQNVAIPAGTTLTIEPGVSVFFDENTRLTVNGRLLAAGTPDARIRLGTLPGVSLATDVDPIKNGVQTGAPKWGGVRIVDSLAAENVVRHVDFVNAQGTNPATSENYGSLGFIRSWGWADNLTFRGTHLRMLYGRNSKLTVTYCTFPDMFVFDPVLGRIEVPADFLASADNRMEPLKVEYPVTDPELSGQTGSTGTYPNGLPRNGHWRVYFNQFNGNRGHQDVFDADSGRWNQPGQFVLDCRYNTFNGLTGDEHIDLGGDAYIAHNRFYSGSKDQWTIDTGYSNAISSGDKGSGTTIMVSRNVFYDLDHAINCKINTATIFEHNTCVDFHQDWTYTHTVNQNVACAAVNLYVPNDGNAAGDGAHMAYNVFHGNTPAPDDTVNPDPPGGFPRLISWPDQTTTGTKTSVIRIEHNFIDDRILDTNLGVNHPGGVFDPAWGTGNAQGDPLFADKAGKDFSLRPESPARGSANGGLDYGATVPEWAYILDAPPALTGATNATVRIGGPGLVAFRWRLDGGSWSAPIQIGDGGVMSRTNPVVRQHTLNLTGLADGAHTLEVLGQDMAGNWQDNDPARVLEGTPQFGPTEVSWNIDSTLPLVMISELAANTTNGVDWVELYNSGSTAVDLGLDGWTLTDSAALPAKFIFPSGTVIAAGGRVRVDSAASGILLDRDGDDVRLFRQGVERDAIAFGPQPAGYTLGRAGRALAWTLCLPTPDEANDDAPLGPPSGLRISEWVADGDVLYLEDWVEIQNTGHLPVELTGLTLTDNLAGNTAAFTFPAHSYIGPGGYQVFIADGDTNAGPNHLSFSLDAQEEQLALLDGDSLLHQVMFFPQTGDTSQGRTGTGVPVTYELPTSGFLNGVSDPAYTNALAVLRGLRVTEIMYNGLGGNATDWIELRNTGSTPFNLAGVSFVEGIQFTFGDLTLNPGEEILVVADIAAFTSRYGAGAPVAGQYAGRLDNGGERLTLRLAPPFDGNVLTFGYNDDWYVSTDGQGQSLDLRSAGTAPGDFGDRDSWLASVVFHGTPGGILLTAPNGYTAWLGYYATFDGVDTDLDSLTSLIEYALGLNPRDGGPANGPAMQPDGLLTANNRLALAFSLPVDAGQPGGYGRGDVTYVIQGRDELSAGDWVDLATRAPGSGWTGSAAVTAGALADGRQHLTVEDVLTTQDRTRRYLRLTLRHTP